ncbi:hypothetical protein KIW84_041140 [Lathyrus oleraceus]|uniref:Uncharacterized protein n=1 Tax=Pisum sativum TaxID=3888 RepID=A0A9D5AQS3_PEA|nr:hypothetical protein KIW84_041140 [Pisum sativum]
MSHRPTTALKPSLRFRCLSIHDERNSLNLSPNEENNFSLKIECFIAETMRSSKNDYETEVRMRHSCIPVNLSSINEKLTTTQRAHIECTPFKWAMNISNNFSISDGLLWELVSRWDVRIRGFRVRDMIVPLTPIDVSFALGLSIVGQQFVDVTDYRRLVAENKDFKERITFLEYEVRMMKEARFNTPFEDKVIQDDRHLMNFLKMK